MKNPNMTRRTVIAGATLIPIAAIIPVTEIKAAPQAPAVASTSTVFTVEQRRTLEAFIDRLIPADENGPGAVESGAAEYIERCMADYLAAERPAFLDGLTAVNAFSQSSQGGAFAELSAGQRDSVLTAMEKGQAPGLRDYFNRVRRLTLEGMFSDPHWGGNRNFAGWDLIRYPGARLAVAPEDQKMTVAPSVVRTSLYQSGENHGH